MKKNTILVPVDGSEGSEVALKKAKELAELEGCRIRVMTVGPETASNPYGLSYQQNLELDEHGKKHAESIVKESLNFFEGSGIEVDSIIRYGNPAQEIISYADSEDDIKLIVMGNRGLNAFSRVMLGSVSSRVMNHTEKSVYIVK